MIISSRTAPAGWNVAPPEAPRAPTAAPQATRVSDFAFDPIQAAMIVLLGLTVLFNAILAVVNAKGIAIGNGVVAGIQAGLVGGAFAFGVARRGDLPLRWLALAAVLFLGNLLLSMARGGLNPKFLGDVLTIPAFICLGTRLNLRAVVGLLVVLQVLMAGFGIWELLYPDAYAELFNPRLYYINSRGYSAQEFWSGTDLYVSSVRQDGRLLLSWTDYHRGSSLFLEPVTLGNWTIFVTVFIIAFWGEMRVWERAVLIVGNVACLCVCDGRLATVTDVVLPLTLPFLRLLPGWMSVFVPFAFGAMAATIDAFGFLKERGDTFAGRLRGSLDLFYQTKWDEALGLLPLDTLTWDAGFSYLIQSQSFILTLILWFTICLTSIGENWKGRTYIFGAAIFITLCLSISYSILSIKVVGFLWAGYGLLYTRARMTAAAAGTEAVGGVLALPPRPRTTWA